MRRDLARVAFVALAAAAVWFRVWEPFPHASLIGIGATLVGGYPIFREAFENIVARRMTMELSMTIALVAALAIGQAFTALVIAGFVLAAEILEGLTVSRGRTAIGDLLRYLPQSALRRSNGTTTAVRASDLAVGDTVLVNPGALVPVDGTVVAGSSFVDEARITGEAMPARKTAGSAVFAGTLNGSGAFDVRAERLGAETSFGRIIEAVESAETARAPIERLADRLAGWLVYFALGSAALTFALTRDVVATISVVIVAGACGVAAGTPLAVLGAIGRAAHGGAIVKGGRYLEALAAANVVVFDKTGTLTFGAPQVRALEPAAGTDEATLLACAGLAEARSEHPLGATVVAHARARGIAVGEPVAFASYTGRGVAASDGRCELLAGSASFLNDFGIAVPGAGAETGVARIFVARDGRYLGAITVSDALRPEAAATVAELRRLGIRTILLTGDARPVAKALATRAGIDEVAAEMLPEGKRAFVAALVASGATVVMVGDGVNDAPALLAATVGVAMGSGTDVTRECADVVLIGNDLSRFVAALKVARAAKTIVLQNFVGTVGVDAAGIVLAAAGVLHPLGATLVHVLSELTFILNATRMLAPRRAS